MSWMDYGLLAVILLLVILAAVYLHRHKGGCRGCAYCPYAGECRKRGGKFEKKRSGK